jgi:predicted dehydrogenase
VPEGLNWDVWIGPTEMRPYNEALRGGWMRWWDYSGGEMTNWGAHGIDQIQCALGMDSTGPVEVWPIEPLQRDLNGPVAFRYANGIEVRVDDPKGPHGGGTFRGEKGNMYLNRNDFRTNPPDMIKNMPSKEDIDKWRDERELWTARYHLQNWLDCIKTRGKPISDVEIGHRSVSVCHLVNLARQIGRKFQWDPEKEQIIGDEEANKLVSRPRRKGYELPEPV